MTGLEVCLVIIGLIFVLCSFLFSEHFVTGDTKEDVMNGVNVASVTEEIVRREVEAEVANIIDEKLEEMEVRVDKLTSEKIMAMGEYSEDIQKRISENHDEVMFLYNMLNDKEEVLKNTIRDIEAVKASVKKMAIVNEVANDVAEKNTKAATTSGAEAKQHKEEQQPVPVKAEDKEEAEIRNVNVNLTEHEQQDGKASTKNAKKAEMQTRKREISNNNQMILKLYSQGKTNIEIAKELGLGIGEVRLVIDLFNSR